MAGSPLKRMGLTRPQRRAVAWRDNVETMQRLKNAMFLRAQGHPEHEIYNAINKQLRAENKPQISWKTFKIDAGRCNEIYREQVRAGAVQHVTSLFWLQSELSKDFLDAKPPDKTAGDFARRMEVRAKVANEIRQTVRTIAEIDGSLVQHVQYDADVDVDVRRNEPTEADVLEAAKLAFKLIPGLIDVEGGPEIIDVTPNAKLIEAPKNGSEPIEVAPNVEMYPDNFDWGISTPKNGKGRILP